MKKLLLSIILVMVLCTPALAVDRWITSNGFATNGSGEVYLNGETGLPVTATITDSRGNDALVCPDGGQFVVEAPHFFNNIGYLFNADTSWASVANGATVNFMIKIPADTDIMVNFDVTASGNAEYLLGESPTFSAFGNTITARSKNRSLVRATGALFYADPTITGSGTTIDGPHFISGGSGPFRVGGSTGITDMVLLKNQWYLIQLINVSGAAGRFGISFEYIEY